MTTICPYCQAAAELVTGSKIYPHRPDLFKLNFWLCAPCGAYVGCHAAGNGDGTKPLGRLANSDLRKAKKLAHAAFDPIWKSGSMRRKVAYAWLSEQLGLTVQETHIGEFDIDTCARTIQACINRCSTQGTEQ